ncbi:MAG: peptidylprolyl isomerase, partial [Mariprofundus sp.]|nr:peptidylprolyl isomerase [Mariprofundus sp.]
ARKLDLKVSKEELNKAIERVESSNGMLPGQLKDALKQQGINVEQFKENMHDQILINNLINIAVRSKLQISEESIREYYRKYMAETKPRREMQLGHIFISLPSEPTPELLASIRNKVRNIHHQLVNGEDFARLVAVYSEAPDRQQQGVMGWFTKGSITQRFTPALELPLHGLTEPIRTPSGFHILKALNERWQEPEQVGSSYDEVHARHILLRTPTLADEEDQTKIRSRAEDIASEMKDASDEAFSTRAKEVSQGPSASRGGDLGWFKRGAMVPEFEKVVFAMHAGETSGVVKTQFGLHIIRVVAARHIDPNSLQANRDKITQSLSNIKMQEQLPRWIASLRAEANIKYQTCPDAAGTQPVK